MNKSDNPPDRIEVFSRLRERMATELDSMLESALPIIANDLEAAAQKGKLSMDEQRQLYSAAANLRMEKRTRITAARQAFNERALRCLEVSIDDDRERKALSLLREDELEVQILATDISSVVREEQPGDCRAFAKRIENLTHAEWPTDDTQPLGARTLGSAVGAALKGLAIGGTTKLTIKNTAVTRLKEDLGRLIVRMNQDLIRQGVLPDWKPQIEKQPADVQADVMPDLPLPALWQAEPPKSAEISPPVAVTPVAPVVEPVTAPATPSERAPPPAVAVQSETAAKPLSEKPLDAERAPESSLERDHAEHAINITEMASSVSRKLDRSPLAGVEVAKKLRTLPVLQPVLDIERDAVAFAHSIGTVPYSRESRREFFKNVGDRLKAGAGTPGQVATVEVVGAMFDYVVDDRRLPEPAKPLFWRLQQPTVALSLLDPGYLSNEPRSLRKLIENFGAIAAAYSDEFVKGGELHRRLETVVRAVEIVSSALQVRSAVISQQVDREYGRAVRNVTKLVDRVVSERTTLESTPSRQNRRDYRRRPDKQREIEVSEKLRLMLEDRIGKHQIPETAKEFILTVWLRHLRTAVLRDGEESTEFKLALEVVDDLLWSMETGTREQSRRALAKRIPPLIRMLTSGLKEIGAREEEHKGFFDELFLLHLRKMRRDRSTTGETSEFSELSPLTSLPTLRDEIAASSAPKSASGSNANPTIPSFVPLPTTIIGDEKNATAQAAAALKPRVSRATPARNRPDPSASAAVLSTPSLSPFGARIAAPNPISPSAPTFTPSAAATAAATAASAVVSTVVPTVQPKLTPDIQKNGAASGGFEPTGVARVESVPIIEATPAAGTAKLGQSAAVDDRGPEQKLLEVLNSLDLSDPPQSLNRRDIPVNQLLEIVDRGHWIALVGNDGITSIAKIAWVNSRRTVILLVRYPDRRALSLRMDEFKRRAAAGRAFLIAS